MYSLERLALRRQLEAWLQEDIGTGDVTTAYTIPAGHQSRGIIHAKEAGMIAGLPVAEAVFEVVDPRCGSRLRSGTEPLLPAALFWRKWKAARTVF